MIVEYKGERAEVIAETDNDFYHQFIIRFSDGEILSVAMWKCVILAESVLDSLKEKVA